MRFILLLLTLVPDAVILSLKENFTMTSPVSGSYKVSSEVLVNNEKGLRQATPIIYIDSFKTIGNFSGEIETGGRKIKFGKKDLFTQSISSGLAEDSYISAYQPSGRYPFTVRYEYTVNYKGGIANFPVFAPIETENVLIKSASYTLDLPAGTEIVSYANKVQELPPVQTKDRVRLEWKVEDFQPFRSEFFMPPSTELVPVLYVAPKEFEYGQTPGSQSDWKEYGLWLSKLQNGSDYLSESAISKLREITKDCSNDFEKLKVLYNYLRETTRYVAIELGIGKLKPIAASEVERSGYGDCKALSNYLYAMLKAVGVPSVYYIINTKRATLLPGFTSTGQMNHAMLAVPLRESGDTVFVECTNPRIPLGYRHDNVAGHQIVLIHPEGGELTRVGSYDDSLSRTTQRTDVLLEADGNAAFQVRQEYFLDFAESFFSWDDIKPESKQRFLTEGFKMHPESFRINWNKDNFDSFIPGQPFCPAESISFSFSASKYGRTENGRMFVPLNSVNKKIPTQKSERINDICIPAAYTQTDTTVVHIPKGYSVESMPGSTILDTPWASYSSTASCSGDCVTIVQSLSFKKYRSGKDTYPVFKDFISKVNQSYDSILVLNSAGK